MMNIRRMYVTVPFGPFWGGSLRTQDKGGLHTIRANLWGRIVMKVPFPGSFVSMMFPALSGPSPIVNIQESLDDVA